MRPEIISRTPPPPETLHHNVWKFQNFRCMFWKGKYFRNLINVHEETFESDKRVNIWCHWPALDGWVSPSWLWSCKSHVYFYFSTSFVSKSDKLYFLLNFRESLWTHMFLEFFRLRFELWHQTHGSSLRFKCGDSRTLAQAEKDSPKIFLCETQNNLKIEQNPSKDFPADSFRDE